MVLSPAMELSRLESTTTVKIGVCRYTRTRGYTDPTSLVGLLRPTGNGYTRGSGRVENLTYGYGSGPVTIS